MRIFYAIIFIGAVLAQPLVKGGWLAYYCFNKSYIIAKYCENKAKVELHCDGKCFLKKKLLSATVSAPIEMPGAPEAPPTPDMLRSFFFAPVYFEQVQGWALALPPGHRAMKKHFAPYVLPNSQDWDNKTLKPPVIS